jgi:hypothetical protein
MEKIIDMINQNVKDALKKFQDIKRRTRNNTETKELREDFNKHQSE